MIGPTRAGSLKTPPVAPGTEKKRGTGHESSDLARHTLGMDFQVRVCKRKRSQPMGTQGAQASRRSDVTFSLGAGIRYHKTSLEGSGFTM